MGGRFANVVDEDPKRCARVCFSRAPIQPATHELYARVRVPARLSSPSNALLPSRSRWRMVAEAFAVMGSFFELSTVLLPGQFLVRRQPTYHSGALATYSPRD